MGSKGTECVHVRTITILKVGLVNTDNFGLGTWYINRWLANTNNNIGRDSLLNSHTVMCDCVTNNNNIKHIVPTNKIPRIISSGKSNHCKYGVPCEQDGKRRRTWRSSSRWSGGRWTGPGTGGIVPDGLVQTRLNTFLKAFPNLRGGGAS